MSSQKPEFHDDFISSHASLLDDHSHVDPDWDAIARDLGEQVPPDCQHEFRVAVSLALVHLLRWIIRPNLRVNSWESASSGIASRAIGSLWVCNPAEFQGRSAAAVAESYRVAPKTIQGKCADFSKSFKLLNRGQGHGWNRGLSMKSTDQPTETEPTEPTT